MIKKVTAYKGADGILYETLEKAQKEAEARYADALFGIINGLANCNGKRVLMAEFIDHNLPALQSLISLKENTKLDEEDDD